MTVHQTSKVLLTQTEHYLLYLNLPTVDKTRQTCLIATWLLCLCLHEQQGRCCLTNTVHQQPLTGSQPSSELFENVGPSTVSIQGNCCTNECCLESALRVEGIYMICGIFPSDFTIAIHLVTCIPFDVYGYQKGFFPLVFWGVHVNNNCPQTFFSAENLKKLQWYHSSVEDFDESDRSPASFCTPLAGGCLKTCISSVSNTPTEFIPLPIGLS